MKFGQKVAIFSSLVDCVHLFLTWFLGGISLLGHILSFLCSMLLLIESNNVWMTLFDIIFVCQR